MNLFTNELDIMVIGGDAEKIVKNCAHEQVIATRQRMIHVRLTDKSMQRDTTASINHAIP